VDNKLLLAVNFLGVDKLSGSIKNIIGSSRGGAVALKGMRGEARKPGTAAGRRDQCRQHPPGITT
jgi:hypothetical protein